MPVEVSPKETSRASAYELWIQAPNPMVTVFNNPFMIWGKYRKKLFRYYLPVSFQFHHTQMDGAHAGRFLENLQKEINDLRKRL